MQSCFHPLSINFYKTIGNYYKNRGYFPKVIYDCHRSERYSDKLLSYDGKGEDLESSLLIKNQVMKNNVFPHTRVKLQKVNGGFHKGNVKASHHIYIRVDHPGLRSIIIDPTYKQLFFVKRGRIEKWFSPYAEYLYRLPPVFVGTETDLKAMVESLQVLAKLDEYHKEDAGLFDTFHFDSKEYEHKKFNNYF